MLVNTSPVRAIGYLLQICDQISSLDELMQQAVIEIIRKDREGKGEGGKEDLKVDVGGIKIPLLILPSKHEAAMTLTTLTQNPEAVNAAAACFIDFIVKETDINFKMIILSRVEALRSKHDHVLDDMVMEILRVLSSYGCEEEGTGFLSANMCARSLFDKSSGEDALANLSIEKADGARTC
ncbi:hypothetical protein DFH28DRAFT_1125904 [Melampsora americana]|nr:hypothetical protein DFH28DRAFT_1125904 [Melampsora americana]